MLLYVISNQPKERTNMTDYLTKQLLTWKRTKRKEYEEAVLETIGSIPTFNQLTTEHANKLYRIRECIEEKLILADAPLDVNKVAKALQHATQASSIGTCDMVTFSCSFCGKTESWGSGNTPKLCSTCAHETATKLVLCHEQLFKEA